MLGLRPDATETSTLTHSVAQSGGRPDGLARGGGAAPPRKRRNKDKNKQLHQVPLKAAAGAGRSSQELDLNSYAKKLALLQKEIDD